MYNEDDLDSAVQAGVMSAQTAAAFRAHVAHRDYSPAVDEEHFRLITGFNDIFVVIACTLLLVSVNWIGAAFAAWLGPLGAAGAAWGCAEFFVRRRRMALPAIVLLLAFVGCIFYAIYSVTGAQTSYIASGGAALAAWCHWLRFRVPVTVAAGTAALVGTLVGGLMVAWPQMKDYLLSFVFVAGIAVFTSAMWWDIGDKVRLTRRSDVAFWLHLLAAPLLVHPVFSAVAFSDTQPSMLQGGVVLALYIAIGLVSVAIDRRALMVSALAYVLYAFSSLLKIYGVVSLGFALAALCVGSALLLLSAFWHPCRRLVLSMLPSTVINRLPAAH